jgi:hypothetical protein
MVRDVRFAAIPTVFVQRQQMSRRAKCRHRRTTTHAIDYDFRSKLSKNSMRNVDRRRLGIGHVLLDQRVTVLPVTLPFVDR